MARMIPDIDPKMITNDGERAFYTAASKLPYGYTVLYSYKYQEEREQEQIKEADFVVVHPSLGYLVVEVKQGDIAYNNGVWMEYKNRDYRPMRKDPVEQARNAMYAILKQFTERTRRPFPLKIKYAVAFPECSKISGQLPGDLDENSIFLFDDLQNLEHKITSLFDAGDRRPEMEATVILLDKILAPSFKIFSKLEDRIDMFHKTSEAVLTDEQQRILEETELDTRKIFFGAAGTGKTFLAKEKARRLSAQGLKVFLTCFNRYLAQYEFASLSPEVTVSNFHDYLEKVLDDDGCDMEELKASGEMSDYYDTLLPSMAFDYFSELDEDDKFDAVIVDEGQDFKEEWITCLESMLKKDGEFYIFADPNQSLFNGDIEKIKKLPFSKQKLTRNLRNTEEVNQWMTSTIPSVQLKSFLKGGLPVRTFKWKTPKEERKLIEDEVGRLISQGVQPKRVVILSPHRKENSCLAGSNKIKDWPLVMMDDHGGNTIRFSTIRSFKGLEADIVFLIGVDENSRACTKADVYVGGSRARFLLYVFERGN